ncbi:hypothetical protein EPO56_03435 [Patescibacteria group bacterium]|nr:MAG: hypothetical protein EPO56_03435 [Patescibacteria group bacterium]
MKKLILPGVIVALLIVGGLSYSLYKNTRPNNGVMCTQEALMCPDGSYVGRGGEMCAFKSCPQLESIDGILEQNNEGFRLIFGSPANGGGVSYVMPIEIKASNVSAQIINKRVTLFGAFSEGNMYVVDRLEEFPGGKNDRAVGEVSVGKTTYINGVRITLNNITSDSRCPTDVTCITKGFVTAEVTLQSDTDKEIVNINSDAKSHAFDSFYISIIDVAPASHSKKQITPESYVLTFKVARN